MLQKLQRKISIILFIFILIVIYRYISLLSGNIAMGEYSTSPNGIYEANVMNWHRESFFGTKRQWFEFTIVGKNQTQKFTTSPINDGFLESRQNKVIHWELDSSAVKFVFPEMEIRMKVQIK
jgi:hypothetical protein